jgi:hypothetical protein
LQIIRGNLISPRSIRRRRLLSITVRIRWRCFPLFLFIKLSIAPTFEIRWRNLIFYELTVASKIGRRCLFFCELIAAFKIGWRNLIF